MKKILYSVLFLSLSTVSYVFAQSTKQLVILHTNDTHSCIFPLNKNLDDTLIAGRGGFLRRASMLVQQRKSNPNILLFDSGDFSQGSSYYTMFNGFVEVGLMNTMHYDAAAIGNHEFDFGEDNMYSLFKKASFPIVCANYDFGNTKLKDVVKPYVIIDRDSVRIGVFGISPVLNGLVFANNYRGITYLDPVHAAQETANLLRFKEKCDIVICLSHLGWDDDLMNDQILMSKTRHIDIVLGGHSHTYFKTLRYVKNLDGVDVPNDQNGKSGIFVGKIILDLVENHSK